MGMGMKSSKWEGIGTKNLFPHTSSYESIKLHQINPNKKSSRRRGEINGNTSTTEHSAGLNSVLLMLQHWDRS